MRAIKERRLSLEVLETIETVGQGPVPVHAIPDNFITLEQATQESIRDLDLIPAKYSSQTVWQDIGFALDQLYRVWTKIKEAADDLRLYVPMCLTSHKCSQELSIESLSEECVYIGDQGICATILTRIIEEAYNKFKPAFDNVLDLIASAFREEDRTLQSTSVIGISIAARAVRFLGMVREVENQLKRVPGDTFRFLATESFHAERGRTLERLLEQMCDYIEALQRVFLQPRHLYAKGSASIKRLRSLAEVLRRCWSESGLLVRHLRKVYPEFTPLAYGKHAHLLSRAASFATVMQTSSEVQAYLSNSAPMCYNDEIVEDVLKSQLWLLPCLIDLFGLSVVCAKKLNSTAISDTRDTTDAPCVEDLKRVSYDLIVATIARASWLMTWVDQSTSPNLFNLRDQGSQTLFFIYNYNKSNLSLKFTPESPTEDLTRYSSLLFSTNTLIDGLLRVHGMIQTGELFTQGLEEAMESSTRSEEADGILFHEVEALKQLLSSQLSVRSFPVLPDDSWETESRSEADSAHALNMTLLNQVPKSEESFSSFSFDLSTGFVDMVLEKANEVQDLSVEEHLPVVQEAKDQAGPSRTCPFIQQMPKAKLPRLRRQISWGSRSSWLNCLCFKSQETEPRRGEDQRSSASNVGLLLNEDLNRTCTGVPSVRADQLEAQELIGSGSAGNIWKMTYSSKPVAVKIMNEGLSSGTRQQFFKATELYNRLSGHPHIVQLTGICPEFLEPEGAALPNLAMIMELCDLGDLFKILCDARWVRDKKNFNQDITEYMTSRGYMIYSDWSLRLKVACDITAGVAHMHNEGIVHRDLTSYNVVVKREDAGEWITKVCDFERSREIPESGLIPRSDTFANSPAWAAPEIIDNRDYSTQADVYSMGVILWELMTLQNPHELYMECVRSGKPFCNEYKQTQLLSQLHNSCESELPELTQELTSLVHRCLLEDFHARPTMNDLHQSLTDLYRTFSQSFQ